MGRSDNHKTKVQEFKNRFKVLPFYELKAKLNTEPLEKEASIAIRKLIEERESAQPVHREVHEAFLSGERIEGIYFKLNQRIEIDEQSLAGKFGYIISIVRIDQEPAYLVELEEDGRDVELLQSQIKIAE